MIAPRQAARDGPARIPAESVGDPPFASLRFAQISPQIARVNLTGDGPEAHDETREFDDAVSFPRARSG
jgi:hypothetical protein